MDLQTVREIVTAAVHAPSVHNSQPWRFVARARELQVWADPQRRLPVVDPAGRELRISCGAAVAMAETYARARGLSCRVTLLPEPAQPSHLADLALGVGDEPSPETVALAEAIRVRTTDRRPFAERPVPHELVVLLQRAAERHGAWLHAVSRPADRAVLTVSLSRAESALRSDPAYLDELSRWTGRGADAGDGVPAGQPAPDLRASSYRLRDFTADASPKATEVAIDTEPGAAEHPLVVVLGTHDDDPRAWLSAGRAFGELLLTATTHGLAASPMTQALEVEGTRARLTHDLGVVGHPQVVLRIGFPVPGPTSPPAPRRPLAEVLEIRP